MNQKTLLKLRQSIDSVDQEIITKITERAKLAGEIASIKKQDGVQNFYQPAREAEVLRSIISNNNSLLQDADLAHIFREIMSACLALEQPQNIAYLGPAGTFTQEAALKHFGNSVKTTACASLDEIFQQVEKDNVDYGVVPIENSSNGVVGATIDLLSGENLTIEGEVEVAVHHQLMTTDSGQKINTIYAHQQALDQCRKWLISNYPDAELKPVSSNAEAAKILKSQKNAAAIASNAALNLYDLQILAKNIEDRANNSTRFLVLGKNSPPPSSHDKTSLLMIAKHQAGSLFDLLEPFKTCDINILQLARHPIVSVKWEYLFLLDIEGHQADKNVQKALKLVQQKSLKLKILGSYPAAVL